MHLTIDAALNKMSYADERLDALLSITGRMDGYLYRCRNDQSYTMLYISDGISNISGYPPGDFIQNKVLEYVSVIHPDDLERVFAAVNTALEAKRNWNVDYRIVPNFGRAVWVREIGGGVFNDAGELVFLEGFVIDISDRKLIEDRNAYLLTQLKDVNELLSAQKRELQLAKQKSDHSANHDSLTGLPNRRAFHSQLKLAMDESQLQNTPVGLLFIDLDRFKEVNDTLGHESGDALLQHVSRSAANPASKHGLCCAAWRRRIRLSAVWRSGADARNSSCGGAAYCGKIADRRSFTGGGYQGRLHRWRCHVPS